MADITPDPEVRHRQRYLAGVDLLVSGRIPEAMETLRPAAEEGHPGARLALGKACLEQRDGQGAIGQFRVLLEDPPTDPGMLGYLHLLVASAEALLDREEAAESHLETARNVDPRMEHAARDLRRRLRKGRPPLIRF